MRGAWIEMISFAASMALSMGRSPCGERGLKWRQCSRGCRRRNCRSPCGERGLKSADPGAAITTDASLPVRGAWIEIDITQ